MDVAQHQFAFASALMYQQLRLWWGAILRRISNGATRGHVCALSLSSAGTTTGVPTP
jgi:hypothetical protein